MMISALTATKSFLASMCVVVMEVGCVVVGGVHQATIDIFRTHLERLVDHD